MAILNGFRNIFGNMAGGIVGVSGLPLGLTTSPRGTPFKKRLVYSDFVGIATADQTVTAGKYVTVGTYTIGAQKYATFGFGNVQLDPMNQGRIAIDTENTSGVDIDGWIRLLIANASETAVYTALEERTETLSENLTDMSKWLPLTEYGIKAGEDSKLIIQFKPDTSGTLDSGETLVYIDITEWQ